MKKIILLTGAGGFIGSNFVKKFENFYKFICLFKDKKKIEHKIFKNQRKIIFNFLKKKKITVTDAHVEAILHMASINENLSKKNSKNSKKFHHNSIIKIIDFAKKNRIKKIIKLSSIKVYGQNLNKVISEKTIPNPETPYAKHTEYSDKLLLKLGKKKKIKIIILRLTNGFGAPIFRDIENSKIIMNNFFFQAKKNNVIKILSDKNYLKNFISLQAILKCIHFFVNKDDYKSGIYIFGSRNQTSLYSAAQLIKKNFCHFQKKNIAIVKNFKNNYIPNGKFKVNLNKLLKAGFHLRESKKKEIKLFFKNE